MESPWVAVNLEPPVAETSPVFPSADISFPLLRQKPLPQSGGLKVYGLRSGHKHEQEHQPETPRGPGRITLTVDNPSLETTASLIQIAAANNTRFRVERDWSYELSTGFGVSFSIRLDQKGQDRTD
ncbi:hypothetical protein BDW72DRAFT_108649 [Aspergillus terricola var. indicus]